MAKRLITQGFFPSRFLLFLYNFVRSQNEDKQGKISQYKIRSYMFSSTARHDEWELCVLTMRNKEVFWPAVTQTRLEETQLQRKLNWNSWNHFKVSWRDVHQLRQRSVFHLCRREVWEGVCDRENASLQCIKGRNVVQLPRKTFFLLSQAWDKERKHIRSLTRTRTPDLRYCALMPCQ